MGWSGYGIYCGDDTQTQHISFLETVGVDHQDAIDCMLQTKTKLTDDMACALVLGVHKLKKSMPKLHPKFGFTDEDDAMTWHMLLALFVDNNLFGYVGEDDNPFTLFTCEVYEKGMLATEYLLETEQYFNEPAKRRAALRRFMARAKNAFEHCDEYWTVEAA